MLHAAQQIIRELNRGLADHQKLSIRRRVTGAYNATESEIVRGGEVIHILQRRDRPGLTAQWVVLHPLYAGLRADLSAGSYAEGVARLAQILSDTERLATAPAAVEDDKREEPPGRYERLLADDGSL
jgi:hypothetical protein